MNKEEILAFINRNPVCYLATLENDSPHVRGMLIYRADQDGIIFHTGSNKDLYQQLLHNPNVEFCFTDLQKSVQIRVSGKADLVKDASLKEEIIKNRDFLKRWIQQYGNQILAVFSLRHGQATLWIFDKYFDKKNYIQL